MIVKNEESFIEGCLLSVKEIANEVVVADTGSTDRTIAIAEQHGARVAVVPWNDDFSAARNASIDRAIGDWILVLDADERFAPHQSQLLKKLLANAGADAYLVTIKGDHAVAEGVVRQENSFPRLFRRHPAIRFEGVVHEQATPSLMRSGKKILPSNLVIEHLGYGRGAEVMREKCERNIALLNRQLQKNPHDAYARYQLGSTYAVLGDYQQARTALSAVQTQPSVDRSIRASTLNILAEIELRNDAPKTAIQHAEESLALVPDQSLARWILAAAQMTAGKFRNAQDVLEQLLEPNGNRRSAHQIAHDISIPRAKVLFQLGCCCELMNDFDSAAHCFAAALQENSQMEEPRAGFLRVAGRVTDVSRTIAQGRSLNIFSYPLYKRAMDESLRRGELRNALSYLDAIVHSNAVEIPPHIHTHLQELQKRLEAHQ